MDKKETEKNIHAGHRERLRKRFLSSGLDGFSEHEVLELLLCYAIARRDTNGLAHRLIDRFGSLSGVLDASANELMSVDGVGQQAAVLIKLIPQMSRKYQISGIIGSQKPTLDKSDKMGQFITPYFQSETEEVVYMICLDQRCKLICVELCARGSEYSSVASVKSIVETAARNKAFSVVLAHNHPGGTTYPSMEDRKATRQIRDALALVDISLADHLIVAGSEFASMNENGYLD